MSEIAERAHRIWEREGRPDGRDMDHWLRAEREAIEEALAKEAPHVEGVGAKSTGKKRSSLGAGKRSRRSA